MKRILTALLALASTMVLISATATPAQALIGYRQIDQIAVGYPNFAQLRLYYNGARNAAAMFHVGASAGVRTYTDVQICRATHDPGGYCTDHVGSDNGTWDSGGYTDHAGYVATIGPSPSCIIAAGAIVWNGTYYILVMRDSSSHGHC